MNCHVKWVIFAIKEYIKSHSTIDTTMTIDELFDKTIRKIYLNI
jgi:hypothetical protein